MRGGQVEEKKEDMLLYFVGNGNLSVVHCYSVSSHCPTTQNLPCYSCFLIITVF